MRIGNLLIVAGVALVAVGLAVRFVPGLFSWFGRLPGDLQYEGDRTSVFVPITSTILVSVGLTVLVNLVIRWWR